MRSAPLQIQLKAGSDRSTRVYNFRSTYGIEDAETIRPEEILLMQGVDIENTSALISVDSRMGVIGCVLGDKARAGRMLMTESNARSSLVSELNRKKNVVSNAETMISSNLEEDCLRKFDIATYVPKKSDPAHMVRQKIFEIAANMREESVLYFSAEKLTAEKYRDFLERFGEVSEKVKDNCTLLEVRDPEQPRNQGFLDYRKIEHSIKGVDCKFKLLEGFSTGEERSAVEMLSRELEPNSEEDILDFSSSFGGVGIFSNGLSSVKPTFVTRNTYLRDLIQENCELNNLEEFEVLVEDGAEGFKSSKFDKVAYFVDSAQDQSLVEEDFEEISRVLKNSGKAYICHDKDFKAVRLLENYFKGVDVARREVDQQVVECHN